MAAVPAVPRVRVKVASPVGLHARIAAVFVRAVVESGLPVTITKVNWSDGEKLPDGEKPAPVDARSILQVLALDVAHGDEVELSAGGDAAVDAADVLARLAELLRSPS